MRPGGISIRPEEILGVPRDATREEVSQARGRLAKKLHPDLGDGQSTAIMQLINHAVEVMTSGQGGSYRFTQVEEEAEEAEPRPEPGGGENERGPGPGRRQVGRQ